NLGRRSRPACAARRPGNPAPRAITHDAAACSHHSCALRGSRAGAAPGDAVLAVARPHQAPSIEESRGTGMKRVLRFVLWALIGLAALAGALGALFGYFVYTPAPEIPALSGTL